ERIVPFGNFSWAVFAAIIALSMTYFFFTNLIFYALNFMAVPLLIVLHTTIYAGNRQTRWDEPQMLLRMLDHLFPQCFRHLAKPFRLIGELLGSRMQSESKRTAYKIMIGILIA